MPKKDEPAVLATEVALTMRSWQVESMFIAMLRHRSVREEGLLILKESYLDRLGEGYLAYLLKLIRRLSPEYKGRDSIPDTFLAELIQE